jgi:hypothetical protein
VHKYKYDKTEQYNTIQCNTTGFGDNKVGIGGGDFGISKEPRVPSEQHEHDLEYVVEWRLAANPDILKALPSGIIRQMSDLNRTVRAMQMAEPGELANDNSDNGKPSLPVLLVCR